MKAETIALVVILGDTARTTAMLMAVLIGAMIFSNFIATTGVAGQIVGAIRALADRRDRHRLHSFSRRICAPFSSSTRSSRRLLW